MRHVEEMPMRPANTRPLIHQPPTLSCSIKEGDPVNPRSQVGHVHLTLRDYGREEWAKPPCAVGPRRLRVGLYDLAVLLLLVVSLAAAVACLAQIG